MLENPAANATSPNGKAVVSINGDPVPFPKTELQLEALIDRLDIDALDLVQKVQVEEFGAGNREEQADEAKN